MPERVLQFIRPDNSEIFKDCSTFLTMKRNGAVVCLQCEECAGKKRLTCRGTGCSEQSVKFFGDFKLFIH
jgi:hypothetical protein